EGEDCDCGLRCFLDPCCVHSGDASGRGCKLERYAECSPQHSECCAFDCRIYLPRKPCAASTECREAAYCNGTSAVCPQGEPKPSWTMCNSGRMTCMNGECVGSICKH